MNDIRIKSKKAIIFDWDGTLFNSMEYKRENLVKIFTELGADREEIINLYTRLSGSPRRKIFSALFEVLFRENLSESRYRELSRRYTDLNLKNGLHAKLFDDVEESLKELKKRMPLFISSSSDPDELMAVVKATPVYNLFQEVNGSKEGFGKGYEHFEHIQSFFSLKPKDLLFIGDDIEDMNLAIGSNIDSIRILRNGSFPTDVEYLCISSLSDLVNYLS